VKDPIWKTKINSNNNIKTDIPKSLGWQKNKTKPNKNQKQTQSQCYFKAPSSSLGLNYLLWPCEVSGSWRTVRWPLVHRAATEMLGCPVAGLFGIQVGTEIHSFHWHCSKFSGHPLIILSLVLCTQARHSRGTCRLFVSGLLFQLREWCFNTF
jgi:hypothetical protein